MEAPRRKELYFIATGGTIDAKPYPVDSATGKVITPKKAIPLPQSQLPGIIPRLLEKAGLDAVWTFHQFPMRDSKDYHEADMERIAQLIQSRHEDVFIITHGTDRMMQNARYMRQFLEKMGIGNKMVVFTGAMIPLANGERSDGYTNLQGLFERIRNNAVPPGVHVFFDGQFMDPLYYDKDVDKGRFVKLDTPHTLMRPYQWSITMASNEPTRHSPGHNDP